MSEPEDAVRAMVARETATWVTPLGRYDRARWRAGWLLIFHSGLLEYPHPANAG